MSRDGHWNDEALADGVLRKLPTKRARRLHTHLQTCERCLRRYEDWQTLLDREPHTPHNPSELKGRLMQSIARTDKHTQAAASRKKKTFVGIGVVASVVLALLLLQVQPLMFQNDYTAVQDDAAEQLPFVDDPRTNQYDVTPVIATDIRGVVWVNDMTKEMLIRVEGLTPMAHKDYQMWFVDTDGHIQDKVLKLQNGKAVLYLQGDGVERIHHVRTSLEPKGGSPIPTGTDTFIVDLRR